MSSLLTECLPWLPRSTLICLKSCWSAVLKHYFGTWNSKQTGTFNLAEELVAYCESDVKLRKEDCLTLKRLFEQQAHFNPFDHRTIASACNRDLRQNRMEANTIASEPLYGWRLNSNHSKVALEWLHWEDSQLSRLQNAGNVGEYHIPNTKYTVDGYAAVENKVYEFQGCFWHGCPSCYPNQSERHRRLEDRAMEDVYYCTQRKVADLESRGYKWRRCGSVIAQNNPDALCGGRTNAVKFYHQAKAGNLYHPILALRQNDKLTFPICRSCVEEEMNKPMLERSYICPHTPQQRQITETWCTPELKEAVEKGSQIIHMHEVWHFAEEQRKTGLFADYVNTWLKIKEEASGWPNYVGDNPNKQQERLANYYVQEEIQLNPACNEKNPGLRTLAKMMLNSMWGKFGQKPNKPKWKNYDPVKFSECHDSNKYDIRYASVLTEQPVEIHYKHQQEDDPVSPNLNIFIACFTTCWARLKLYEALDRLQECVFYFHTDSVIFKSGPNDEKPPLGDYLGDFKNELNEGDTTTEFASGGPKNYGYRTLQGKQESKFQGVSLNREGSKQLNFHVLKQNEKDNIQTPLTTGVRQTEILKPSNLITLYASSEGSPKSTPLKHNLN